MTELSISDQFNIDSCEHCPKQDICGAYSLADRLREEIGRNITLIDNRVEEALDILSAHPNKSGRQRANEGMQTAANHFHNLLKRSSRIEKLTSTLMRLAVDARIQTDTDTRLNNLEVAAATILPDQRLNVVITAADLEKAGMDLLLYSYSGDCGAFAIDEKL